MKIKCLYIFIIFQFIFLLISCDRFGNVFLTNGYEFNVIVHTFYNYNETIIERFDEFYPREIFAVAARSRKYENIIAIQIEFPDGTVLKEYSSEYLTKLRKVYKKKNNQQESWLFSEKGLFLKTKEITERYNWDNEKIMTYYRSDEAVKNLNVLLE